MKNDTINFIHNKNAFVWVAVVTVVILLIPFIAMYFSSDVNWKVGDFVIMGALLFSTGSIYIFTARKIHKKYRTLLIFACLILFLYVWAELAVGLVLISK